MQSRVSHDLVSLALTTQQLGPVAHTGQPAWYSRAEADGMFSLAALKWCVGSIGCGAT